MNPPLVKRVKFSSVNARTKSGKSCKAFIVKLYSEPADSDLYVISKVVFSENGMKKLKKALDTIAKAEPEIFSE